jgi:hypothetical protein
MATKKLPQRNLRRTRDTKCIIFQQISRRSRYLFKKAVEAQDKEALAALILDMEHSMYIAAGSLFELLHSTHTGCRSFGKYYTMVAETLSLAELEYQKLSERKN